jgi:hypothetical protein
MSRLLLLLLLALLGPLGPLAAAEPSGPNDHAGYLGFAVIYDDEPGYGRFTVTEVVPGTPVARAGLRVGDVITQVNGVGFRFSDWTETVAQGGPFTWVRAGDRVTFSGTRSGQELDISAVAEVPAPAIVETRRQNRRKVVLTRGGEIFARLAAKSAVLRIERAVDGFSVQEQGTTAEEAEALRAYLSKGSLEAMLMRELATKPVIELHLGIRLGTQDVQFKVVP